MPVNKFDGAAAKRHNGSTNSDLISSRSSYNKNTNSPNNAGADATPQSGFRNAIPTNVTQKRNSNVTMLKIDNDRVL